MGIFGERLVEARNRFGWKQAELARRAGVPQQSVQAIEASDQRSSKYLHRFASVLGVSSQWLIGEEELPPAASLIARRAPVRGLVAAGLWLEDDRQIGDDTPVPASPNPTYANRPQIAFKVVGSSMDRLVTEGEYVICVDFAETPMHLRNGDIVVAERRRGGATERTIKRVKTVDGNIELWPDSDDPAHQEPISLGGGGDSGEVLVVGFVIGFYRPL